MRLADAATDFDNVARLNAAEYDCAKVFAYASAEAPIWFSTPTQGVRLFEYAEGRTCEIENGFIGLVERCTVGQEHDFPFFEPNNGRRRMRQLYIRPGVGRTGFADALARRWGRDTVRCSRNSPDDLHPTYFVSAIEAYIELSLGPKQGIPSDSFFVRASYDVDSEVDFSAFVEPLLLPGGGPYESLGEPFWFG
ncbi:MAG TPA: hypothetical protein PLN21_19440 [Gemmatales bacterium]|nr:hypothetical protein [Gemmatales bacterium]